MTLAPAARLGRYEIISLLGVGGMGEVYRARDAALSRDVAVKLLPHSLASDADRIRRFDQEARAAGQRTVLFVDEIHRFNKSQQDALLPYFDNFTVVLL